MSMDGANGDDWHMTDRLHAEHGKGDPFAAAMRATRMPMLITDPRQADNPIVYANNAFLRLTGYDREEVVGNNCRFLQGPETDRKAVDRIRDAIAAVTDVQVDLLNYRKDGSTFWNALYLSPVVNEAGDLQFFFASQLDVTDRKNNEQRVRADKERFEAAVKERTRELEEALDTQTALLHEVDHRVKNNLQMVSSLILMQSRTISDPEVRDGLRAMLSRVEALSTVHRRLYQSSDVTRFDVGDFVRDLATDLVHASGRNIALKFELEQTEIPAEQAAALALMVNEIVTNALKHAFPNGGAGTITLRVSHSAGNLLVEITDDGIGHQGENSGATFGQNLVRSIARQLKATIEWSDGAPGTRVSIRMPIRSTTIREA
jgi:PAS domain S-box-containing protein